MSTIKLEKFLVASANAALVAGGTALIHPTTGVFNISSGQLGVFSTGKGTLGKDIALSAGMTIADAPEIYIAQGTADSAAPKAVTSSILPVRGIERSQGIQGRAILEWTGLSYAAPTHDVTIIGRKDGNAGEINVASETRYQMILAADGRVVDLLNGRNSPAFYPEFTTPDFTDLAITTELRQRDYLLNYLAYYANLESRVSSANRGGGEFVVLCISETGVGAGTAVSGMSAGTYQIGNESDGTDINLLFSADMITSLKEIITTNGGPLDSTAELVPYNLATAGDSGSTTVVDVLVVLALDRPTAYFDRVRDLKTRFRVGLPYGFATTVYNAKAAYAFEGSGIARHLELWYQSTEAIRKFGSEQLPSGNVIEYASPIAAAGTYDVYTIYHDRPDVDTGSAVVSDSFQTIILIDNDDTVTTVSWEALMNPWMESAGKPSVSL